MFVVFDYLFEVKNGFFQELIVWFLAIKLAIEVSDLEMNLHV